MPEARRPAALLLSPLAVPWEARKAGRKISANKIAVFGVKRLSRVAMSTGVYSEHGIETKMA
jgi:hypothetical protein